MGNCALDSVGDFFGNFSICWLVMLIFSFATMLLSQTAIAAHNFIATSVLYVMLVFDILPKMNLRCVDRYFLGCLINHYSATH